MDNYVHNTNIQFDESDYVNEIYQTADRENDYENSSTAQTSWDLMTKKTCVQGYRPVPGNKERSTATSMPNAEIRGGIANGDRENRSRRPTPDLD